MPHALAVVRATVALGCLLPLTLAGCSAEDDSLVDLDAGQAVACEAVMADLPETLFGSDFSDVEGRVATYGDVTVACGVQMPADYEDTAHCSEVEGVGWYVPADVLGDGSKDLVAYALTRVPLVRITAPAEQRLEKTDDSLADLAEPLAAHLDEGLSCL